MIAFDTETALFRPGVMAPELACVTFAHADGAGILHQSEAHPAVESWLRSGQRLVGQFVAYDMAVVCAKWPDLVPLVFAAYDADRVTDTKIRAQMIDIADGVYRGRAGHDGVWMKYDYGLESIARRLLGVQLKKDGWRMRYGSFIDVPLMQWPARAAETQWQCRLELVAFNVSGVTEASLDKAAKQHLKDLRAIVEDPPEQVSKYPVDDAIYTKAVYDVQEQTANPAVLVDQFRQARGDFALHLSSTWGLRTDPEAVAGLRAKTEEALVDVTARLVAAGLVREDGSRDTKAAARRMLEVCGWHEFPVASAHPGPGWQIIGGNAEDLTKRKYYVAREDHPDVRELRLTEGDGVCLDSDACEASEDDLLLDYAEFTGLGKTVNADVAMLEKGTVQPIHCRYGLAASGRTTCSGPNIQNLRKYPGIRECFVPRQGRVFIQGDYPQLELYTLAECCYAWLGYSTLGEMLKKGIDPHTAFAAKLAGCSYEEGARLHKAGDKRFADQLRQIAKVFDFGKPGGLGDENLIKLGASDAYKVHFTLEEAKAYDSVWHATFPEMKDFFALNKRRVRTPKKRATVVLPGTGFVRGGATYCAACNTGFQGLGAAVAKRALWLVARAQYAEPASPLYGSRTAWFVHDEIAAEAAESIADPGAKELVRLMMVAANEYLPNVPYTAEKMADVPTIMRRWSKKAGQAFSDASGRVLVPWGDPGSWVAGKDGSLIPYERRAA